MKRKTLVMVTKIMLSGMEYFQCSDIRGNVGDLFSDWRDIPMEKEKFINQFDLK